jgi:hypothetical protein
VDYLSEVGDYFHEVRDYFREVGDFVSGHRISMITHTINAMAMSTTIPIVIPVLRVELELTVS